jgi:hypothetical protein
MYRWQAAQASSLQAARRQQLRNCSWVVRWAALAAAAAPRLGRWQAAARTLLSRHMVRRQVQQQQRQQQQPGGRQGVLTARWT